MNVALIFAGGTGKRMNSKTVPKQFLQLYGKPIIVYTLDIFENHDQIDAIVVVCLEAWIPEMNKYIDKFGLKKVRAVVPGGASGQESIYNGLKAARDLFPDDTTMLVHDGVRPLIAPETITEDIKCVKKNGNAITVTPATETIFLDNSDAGQVGTILDRKKCLMAKAPQCFKLGDLLSFHEEAIKEGKGDFIDSANMAKYYGHELFTVEGKSENIKITTPIDYYMFRAIIDARENSQIFGL